MNNDEFIDGLRRQDPLAARHLNDCLVPSIWRFVYFRVDRNHNLAEDIVSETVLALVDAVSVEKNIEHPAAWLRTVATRRVQDHYRAAARVEHLLKQGDEHVVEQHEDDPVKQHDDKLKQQSVREAMGDLPDDYRAALEWKYVDKLDVRSIAKRLDTTEKAAESILFRARNALRKLLRNEFPELVAKTKSTRPVAERPLNTGLSRGQPPSAELLADETTDPRHDDEGRLHSMIHQPANTPLGIRLSDGT